VISRTLVAVVAALLVAGSALAQGPPPGGPPHFPPGGGPPGGPPPGFPGGDAGPRGLLVHEKEACPGYTLIAPLRSKTIFLVDLDGKIVHEWKTGYTPGSEYFLDDGNLLRCSHEPDAPRFHAGGQAGRLQELTWDGKVVWDMTWATDDHLQHHDIVRTPQGTILAIAYEYKTRDQCLEAGRHPAYVGKDGLWSDYVIEIDPTKPSGGDVIWEWHVWDHLIQDVDKDADNFGDVAAHPELFDVNADARSDPPSDADVAKMQALGYISDKPKREELHSDWFHTNAIDYDADLDEIVLSSPHLSEIWILDHSTTSDQAAGHSGGNSGKGGDLLWRWGNPKNYGGGGARDQKLFGQHNVHWIAKGLAGAGHLLVFNNGGGRGAVEAKGATPGPDYSSVYELATPLVLDAKGHASYGLEPNAPAGPAGPCWEYHSPDPKDFFSSFISGAQRLPNGNTMICEGARGRVFEVTPDHRIVWDFRHPFNDIDPADGPGGGGPPNALFRATRIPIDAPGLKGKELRPIDEADGAKPAKPKRPI